MHWDGYVRGVIWLGISYKGVEYPHPMERGHCLVLFVVLFCLAFYSVNDTISSGRGMRKRRERDWRRMMGVGLLADRSIPDK